MKKITLIAVLLLSGIITFAQTEEFSVGTSMSFHEKDTSRTFLIFGSDKDIFIENLANFAGRPATYVLGSRLWNDIAIEGIGKGLQVKMTDGIMTTDVAAGSSCFVPFTGEEDKQKKLAVLQQHQKRRLQVEITDGNGYNPVRNDAMQQAAIAFLVRVYKKS